MAGISSSSRLQNTPSSPSTATDDESLRRNRIISSKLYFHVPPSKVPVIYSSSYDISFLGLEKLHPFDSSKWGRVCQFLMTEGILDKNSIVEPIEASQDDLLVVHSEAYLRSLKSSLKVSLIIEVPPLALLPNFLVQWKVLHPFRKQVGGTILAGKLAKERGWAINVGGGFHHCCAERGGGFCAYADISLCIHYAFVRLNISRVMIIDLDAHQGNGHEMDFAGDRRVYILDMFNTETYPLDFEARRYIDQKVELVSGTTTNEYLEQLDKALTVAERNFDPELVVYNAGTDILDGDPLGRDSYRDNYQYAAHIISTVSASQYEHMIRDNQIGQFLRACGNQALREALGPVQDTRELLRTLDVSGYRSLIQDWEVHFSLDLWLGREAWNLEHLKEVSPDGIISRDEKVFRFAKEKNVPLLMLTSGGYMKSSARVIADSIANLSNKCLIDMSGAPSVK